ncbi:MAG TPA: c-type cytochrome [Dongiaceae bacterium]
MSAEHRVSPRDRWPRDRWVVTGIAVTAIVFAVAALFGLVILPYAQPDLKLAGIWDAICSAAGIARTPSSTAPVEPDYKISNVVMTATLLEHPDAESIGRGATLAHQCAICHGPTGISRADSPNLGGQYANAIYKQLLDFKSGARVNAIMTPFALALSEQDMIDVAAYYQFLPRLPAYHPDRDKPAPKIVLSGAPMRNIPPCGACHGTLDNKPGAPWLEGQPAAYVKSQLEAFATGTRRNDISEQMRNIARGMTPEEMDAVAQYYGSQAPE